MIKFYVFLCFLSFLGCKAGEKNPVAQRTPRVDVEKVMLREFYSPIETFGTVSYKTKHDVSALVPGHLDEIYVKDGDWVHEGQSLAKLRNIQFELQLEQAQNEVEAAGANLKSAIIGRRETILAIESKLIAAESGKIKLQQKEAEYSNLLEQYNSDVQLFSMGGISESEFENSKLYLDNFKRDLEILRKEIEISMLGLRPDDLIAAGITPAEDYNEFKKQIIALNCETADAMVLSAEAAYENAEKNVLSYQKIMDELILKAKVSGIVGAHYFESGEYVAESSKVFTLIDTDTVTTIFSIQESEITGFKIGSDVKIYIQSIDSSFDTKISEISPMVDSQSGNFTVKAELPNSKNLIKPGMFAKCVLPNGKQRKFLTLSEDCLTKSAESHRVFTVINKILVEKELDVIHRKEGKIWFTDELNENSVVIKNPAADLQEGMVVDFRHRT